MRCAIVYGVVVGVALFGGGGSDASRVQSVSVVPSAPSVQTMAVRRVALRPAFERASAGPGLQSP